MSTTSNIDTNALFIRASRKKVRISTTRGLLSVEDLWDLSLKSLDEIAVALDAQLQPAARKSFIEAKPKGDDETQDGFDIVKFVIDTKLAEKAAAKEKAERNAQIAFLRGLREKKQLEALEGLSEDEINKKLSELGVEA